MNHRHLIDSAIFDTAFANDAVPFERRGEIEEFVKTDLMKVIDEVFDTIDGNAGAAGQVFRIDNLDLDLGEIPFAEYRQQMPKKLREQLMLAFADQRRPTRGGSSAESDQKPGQIDRNSAEQEQLFYFLRFGYLPWYSRLEDDDALEKLLFEIIDSTPAALIDLLRENAQQAVVMRRLEQQFSAFALENVRRLLPSTTATTVDRIDNIDDLYSQLVEALQSGDAAMTLTMWSTLRDAHPELLRSTLEQYGQQAGVRQHIVATFSPTRFVDLLLLLEPAGHGRLQTMLERVAGQPAADQSRLLNRLREYVLAYLLVERDGRFDEHDFIDSLLRQLAGSDSANLQTESVGEVMRQLRELAAELRTLASAHQQGAETKTEGEHDAETQALNTAEAYRQYERLRSVLTTTAASIRANESRLGLLADFRALRQDAPWLLMRLYRELQTGNAGLGPAIESLTVEFLIELTDLFVMFASQTAVTRADGGQSVSGAVAPAVAVSELAEAIRSHAASSNNRQFFYAYIIGRLIQGELIDFDALDAEQSRATTFETAVDHSNSRGSVAIGRDEVIATDATEVEQGIATVSSIVPSQMLLCAELLTTASYATSVSFSVEELERIKWQIIGAYLIDTGNLFNERFFTLQFVASLVRQAKIEGAHHFRETLVQGLQQNSLPSTSAMVGRLTRWLADESKIIPVNVVDTERNLSESVGEATPLEDIHIANAGAVLFAPYLPRLFERLGLTEDGQFKNRGAAERGVHCLQFLVNESSSSPEYQLVLNKLLCGVRPGLPIRRSIELSADEVEQLEGLLQAIIEHWKVLGNTSITALRESFLQRNGRLQRENDAWRLTVESRPFDMLLDQIPWSFATIKYPWMERVLYVEWR